MTLPTLLDVSVQISLDRSGNYDGEYDDVTAAVAVEPGVTIQEGREGARALLPPKVPTFGFVLRNDDGRYSVESAGSAVYQVLIPGRPARVMITHGDTRDYDSEATYDDDVYYDGVRESALAQGTIDDIQQTAGWGERFVEIECLGTMASLVRRRVTVPVQAAIRTDQAISLLLDAVKWPTDKRAISVGDTQLIYWWCDDRKAWDAILELLAAEGPCQFYESADGVIHFENRNYRALTARSSVSQATFKSEPAAASDLWFTRLEYDPGYRSIYNHATYATRRRELQALGVVWEYGATLSLTTNQTTILTAKASDPFQNAVTPAAGTDYTVTVGSLASLTMSATSGQSVSLQITAGGSGATVTGLQLRAQALTTVSETTVENTNAQVEDESITKYNVLGPGGTFSDKTPRALDVPGWPEIEPSQAEAVCTAWVERYHEHRPQIKILVRNADGAHLEQILDRQVSDRITLVDANTGLASDVWVETRAPVVTGAHGRVVACELGCELVEELVGAVWDDDAALWDDAATVWGS